MKTKSYRSARKWMAEYEEKASPEYQAVMKRIREDIAAGDIFLNKWRSEVVIPAIRKRPDINYAAMHEYTQKASWIRRIERMRLRAKRSK